MNFLFGNFVKTLLTCFSVLVLFLCNYYRPPYFNIQETCGTVVEKIRSGKGGLSSILEFNVGNKVYRTSVSKWESIGNKYLIKYEKYMPFIHRISDDKFSCDRLKD